MCLVDFVTLSFSAWEDYRVENLGYLKWEKSVSRVLNEFQRVKANTFSHGVNSLTYAYTRHQPNLWFVRRPKVRSDIQPVT